MKVRYRADGRWGQQVGDTCSCGVASCADPAGVLEPGGSFVVTRIELRASHVRYWVCGRKYNAVHFEKEEG